MNPLEFQESELELFLDTYVRYDDIRGIICELNEDDHPAVRDATKRGIKCGVKEFLAAVAPGEWIIYRANTRWFALDDRVQRHVQGCVGSLSLASGLDESGVRDYARFVCENYRMFVYNESGEKFRELFTKASVERQAPGTG